MVTSSDGSPFTVTNYQWNTGGCFTNNAHNTPTCFPTGQTTQNVTGNSLLAEDAGTITCTVTIGGVDYTSGPLTLHISGVQKTELSIYVVIYVTFMVYIIIMMVDCGISLFVSTVNIQRRSFHGAIFNYINRSVLYYCFDEY